MNDKRTGTEILHVAKYPPGRGGMDFIQQLHADVGEPCLALLHRNSLSMNRSSWGLELDFSPAVPLAWLGWRANRIFAEHESGIELFYNCWGADLVARPRSGVLRVGYLHSDFPRFADYIRHFSGWLDGFLAVSQAMASRARLFTERPVDVVACALQWQPSAEPRFHGGTRELVLGYSGRVAFAQKRLDRLPDFLARLDTSGLSYRFEILGDGPDTTELMRRVGHHPCLVWHGWKSPSEMATIMAGWRHAIFFSDYEGLSLALLEAIGAGVLPLYPRFGEGDFVGLAAEYCHYPQGDLDALVELLRRSEEIDETGLNTIRLELWRLLENRSPASYIQALQCWADKARAEWRPRIGSFGAPLCSRATGLVGTYNRAYRRLTLGD